MKTADRIATFKGSPRHLLAHTRDAGGRQQARAQGPGCPLSASDAEIAELDAQIDRLARQASPSLMRVKGAGADTVAALLVAAGDNPGRLHSGAAFAHMCGVAPIPASPGKTIGHRLNRGGNREANRAIYMLAIRRLSYDPRARAYAARRTAEGKSKREIVRCLKRYLASEIYKAIISDNAITPSALPRPTGQAA